MTGCGSAATGSATAGAGGGDGGALELASDEEDVAGVGVAAVGGIGTAGVESQFVDSVFIVAAGDCTSGSVKGIVVTGGDAEGSW